MTFIDTTIKEDHQGFVNEIEKIFRVMHATDVESVQFVVYQLRLWCTSGKKSGCS